MSSMFDINTTDLLLNFHGKYIPSKFVFTSDDRMLYVGYAVDCLFKVTLCNMTIQYQFTENVFKIRIFHIVA